MSHREQIFSIAEDYCRSQNWHYEADPEKCMIKLGMNLKCKLKNVRMFIQAKDTALVTYTVCQMNADEADRAKVNEYITRANYGLVIGNFEMDLADGEVRYKVAQSCKTSLPAMDDVERCIDMGFMMFDRYGNGLASLLMGFGEPAELIKEAEA